MLKLSSCLAFLDGCTESAHRRTTNKESNYVLVMCCVIIGMKYYTHDTALHDVFICELWIFNFGMDCVVHVAWDALNTHRERFTIIDLLHEHIITWLISQQGHMGYDFPLTNIHIERTFETPNNSKYISHNKGYNIHGCVVLQIYMASRLVKSGC